MKTKEYNASWPREAEAQLHRVRARYRQLHFHLTGEFREGDSLIQLNWEFPGIEYPEYRWWWIEIDESLQDEIIRVRDKLFADTHKIRAWYADEDGMAQDLAHAGSVDAIWSKSAQRHLSDYEAACSLAEFPVIAKEPCTP